MNNHGHANGCQPKLNILMLKICLESLSSATGLLSSANDLQICKKGIETLPSLNAAPISGLLTLNGRQHSVVFQLTLN